MDESRSRRRPPGTRATGTSRTGDSHPHRAPLEALGLPGNAVTRLEAYLDLLAAWNQRSNLTGARTPQSRVDVLVAAVLPAAPLLEPGRLIDVGSGNGSPGLVLALLRDDVEAVLLEPRARRWAFLREAARASGRARIEVLRLRHDQYPGPPARSVTLRALAVPLFDLSALVAAGGQLLVFGGSPAAAEPFRLEDKRELSAGQLHRYRRS